MRFKILTILILTLISFSGLLSQNYIVKVPIKTITGTDGMLHVKINFTPFGVHNIGDSYNKADSVFADYGQYNYIDAEELASLIKATIDTMYVKSINNATLLLHGNKGMKFNSSLMFGPYGNKDIAEITNPIDNIYTISLYADELTVDRILASIEDLTIDDFLKIGGNIKIDEAAIIDSFNIVKYNYNFGTKKVGFPVTSQLPNGFVSLAEKQGFVTIRFDDTAERMVQYGIPLGIKHRIPFCNVLNTKNFDFEDYKQLYQSAINLGFKPQDHTPYHYTISPPRVRDPYWDGTDDGFHNLTATATCDSGSWLDNCYIPVIYHIPSDAEIDAGTYDAGDKAYFNLAGAVKTYAATLSLKTGFYLDFDNAGQYAYEVVGLGLDAYFDTLYFFAKTGRDYLDATFTKGTDYQETLCMQMVGFGKTEALTQVLNSYKNTFIDSVGMVPNVFIHPGGYKKINFLTKKFYDAVVYDTLIYDGAFCGDFGFFTPATYTVADSAYDLQTASYLGYNMVDNYLYYALTYTLDHDDEISEIKKSIADEIAKGRVAMLAYHFYAADSVKWNSIFSWLNFSSIPVVDLGSAVKMMRNATTNPYKNIIPSLMTDKNDDNIPDGWDTTGVVTVTSGLGGDGESKYFTLATSAFVYVADLFGIERNCTNELSYWVAGSGADSVEIVISENMLIDFRLADSTTIDTTITFTNTAFERKTLDFVPDSLTNSFNYIEFKALSNNIKLSAIRLKRKY